MPLLSLPNNDVLRALGKLTLWFAELEFFVNDCLLQLHEPKTDAKRRKLLWRDFSQRAKDVEETLRARSESGKLWKDPTYKPPAQFAPSLRRLSERRNLLIHGVAFTVLEKLGQQLVGRTYKFSSRSRQQTPLEAEPIEELVGQIARAAEQAQWLALNLWDEKKNRDVVKA